MLGEKGLDAAEMRSVLKTRVFAAGPSLCEVPAKDLLRLAEAARKSPAIEECGIGPVAHAAALTLGLWLPDEVAKMLSAVAASKASVGSTGAQELFVKASE